MASKTLFKVSFVNQGKIYEIFARQIAQSSMYGFVEVEELVFGEKTSLVLDPSEERLKDEFAGVRRTYIPMHSVIRIDEVEKRGTAKILSMEGEAASMSLLTPSSLAGVTKPDNKD